MENSLFFEDPLKNCQKIYPKVSKKMHKNQHIIQGTVHQ